MYVNKFSLLFHLKYFFSAKTHQFNVDYLNIYDCQETKLEVLLQRDFRLKSVNKKALKY